MIKVIIVENESSAAEILQSHLTEHCPEVELIEVCKTVESSLIAIKKYSPDLVFLDIELNNENGFDILTRLNKVEFEIIVTTSFNKYAVQACNASAIYFLLKPISKDELVVAIEKYKKRISSIIDPRQLEIFRSIFEDALHTSKNIALPTMEGYDFVDTDNVIYCQGAISQSIVYFINIPKKVVSRTLKELTEIFSHSNFQRIHKSYLVNINHIKKYFKGGKDGSISMHGTDTILPVSREYKDEFLKRFGKY
jgi:two-component system LytT family response regulator